MATGVATRTWERGDQVLLHGEPAIVDWVSTAPRDGFFWVGFIRGATRIAGIHIDTEGRDNKGRLLVELLERSGSTSSAGLDSDRVGGFQDGAEAPGQGEGMSMSEREATAIGAAPVKTERAIGDSLNQMDESLVWMDDLVARLEARAGGFLRPSEPTAEVGQDLTMVSSNSDIFNDLNRKNQKIRDIAAHLERIIGRIDL